VTRARPREEEGDRGKGKGGGKGKGKGGGKGKGKGKGEGGAVGRRGGPGVVAYCHGPRHPSQVGVGSRWEHP
jgi:hypothetical protein